MTYDPFHLPDPPRLGPAFEAFKPFPTDVLPEIAARFIREGGAAVDCDESFIALPLLSALGASIGTARRVELRRGWSEFPIVWTALVVESGTKKSPAFDLALGGLHAIQGEEFRKWKLAHAQYEAERAEYERAATRYRKGMKEEAPGLPPDPPRLTHVVTQDATIEALAMMLAETPRGLLLGRDELAAWFGGFNQYKARNGADVPAWLEFHRGGRLKVDRKGALPLYVPRAAVWVTGTIQPAILRRCLSQELHDNGMVPRIMMAAPPCRVSRWTDAHVHPATEHEMHQLLRRLRGLAFVEAADGEQVPVNVRLTPEAQLKYARFVNDHGEEQASFDDQGLRAVWSKLEGGAARFGLIDHLTRVVSDPFADEDTPLGVESIEAGIVVARWFGGEARRVFGILGESGQDRERRELLELIRSLGCRVTPRKLVQKRRRYRDNPGLAEMHLGRLAEAGLGRWEYVQTCGRPSRTFVLNERRCANESSNGDSATPAFVDVSAAE